MSKRRLDDDSLFCVKVSGNCVRPKRTKLSIQKSQLETVYEHKLEDQIEESNTFLSKLITTVLLLAVF